MSRSTLLSSLTLSGLARSGLALTACGPKAATTSVVAIDRSQAPAPLSPRPFQIPDLQTTALANGLEIALVEGHEAPLVWGKLVSNSGGWIDPDDRPGLASVTVDMLNEGAGDLDAAGLAAELRKLGASVSSGASSDGSAISLKTLKSNLGPALDLLASVVRDPTFPEDEWDLMRKKRLQNLDAARQDPSQMAGRALRNLVYGDVYKGNQTTEASYAAMDTAQMKAWWAEHGTPANMRILVGGDVTLAEITPLLDARFGDWTGDAPELPAKPTQADLPDHPGGTIFLVDKPGAPQSVLRGWGWIGGRTDADAPALTLANMAVGGQFVARINMNLREDKGWTYGAWSDLSHNYLDTGMVMVATNVVTPHTADSIAEVMSELRSVGSDKPITAEELEAGRGSLLGKFPLKFENPGYLLDQTAQVERYGLPDDWITGRQDRLRAVDLAAAQAAWDKAVSVDEINWLVVGDAATIKADLDTLGFEIIQIDTDAVPID